MDKHLTYRKLWASVFYIEKIYDVRIIFTEDLYKIHNDLLKCKRIPSRGNVKLIKNCRRQLLFTAMGKNAKKYFYILDKKTNKLSSGETYKQARKNLLKKILK